MSSKKERETLEKFWRLMEEQKELINTPWYFRMVDCVNKLMSDCYVNGYQIGVKEANAQNDRPDPIHQYKGWWYFWDETFADRIGPFRSEEIAQREFNKYNNLLNSSPNGGPIGPL